MRYLSIALLATIVGSTAVQAQNLTLPNVSVRALQAPVDVTPESELLAYRVRPVVTGRSASVGRTHRHQH